jgi:hypothetical protein
MEKRGKFSHSKTLVCLAELYIFKEAKFEKINKSICNYLNEYHG